MARTRHHELSNQSGGPRYSRLNDRTTSRDVAGPAADRMARALVGTYAHIHTHTYNKCTHGHIHFGVYICTVCMHVCILSSQIHAIYEDGLCMLGLFNTFIPNIEYNEFSTFCSSFFLGGGGYEAQNSQMLHVDVPFFLAASNQCLRASICNSRLASGSCSSSFYGETFLKTSAGFERKQEKTLRHRRVVRVSALTLTTVWSARGHPFFPTIICTCKFTLNDD